MSVFRSIFEILRSPETKSTWPWVLASPFVLVLSAYLAIAPVGAQIFAWVGGLFAIGMLAAILAFSILPLFFFSRKFRKKALAWWLLCFAYIPLFTLGFSIGQDIRSKAFDRLAMRSKPLVQAILRFSDQEGGPPQSLDELVPDYLTEIPGTRMMAYPKYEYLTGEPAHYYEGNPWILKVWASSGAINFDRFMYFPRQNYPQGNPKYSGTFEKIRDWAYFHE